MNYDLCDLLNRKLENLFNYYPENSLGKPNFKEHKIFMSFLEKNFPDDFLNLLEADIINSNSYSHWVYRNGKISNNISDFDNAAKLVLREISNMTFSNIPCYDIMYFSGIMKMILNSNKVMYLETCIKPQLDQLILIKDFQKTNEISDVYWKIIDRKNKNKTYEGKSLDNLFSFNWSRIK